MKTLAGILLLGLLVTGCGGDAEKAKAKANTFAVTGAMELMAPAGVSSSGDVCIGTGGYRDLQGGTSVTVFDAKGTKLALGELGVGTPSEHQTCSFPIEIKNVPAGKGPYSIEVSHRGEVGFNEADAGSVKLSIG